MAVSKDGPPYRCVKDLQRLLLVPALLAGELDPRRALFRRDAVRRAAFAAGGLDAGIALLHDQRLAFHGFADQALGLLAHRLLVHPLPPVVRMPRRALYHPRPAWRTSAKSSSNFDSKPSLSSFSPRAIKRCRRRETSKS